MQFPGLNECGEKSEHPHKPHIGAVDIEAIELLKAGPLI
jgi:hypothetical protein